MNPIESPYYQHRQGSLEKLAARSMSDSGDSDSNQHVPHSDANGIQYRPQENGRVIPRGEILTRIVPYYELFITTSGLLGYHILTVAEKHIKGNGKHIFLFGACDPINYQSDIDLCSASMLTWSLIGGAVLYFISASLIAFLLFLECRRNGYPGMFTALWNSPFFLVCYFFNEKHRIDLLTIPNRLMGFRKWTRSHIHRLLFSVYALINTCLIANNLSKKTVDNSDYEATKNEQGRDL
ncbi:13025_t:CDS:2, partial [Ambispora gerdemannii]